MKRKTILTISALAVTAAVGAFAIPAVAGGPNGWGPGMGDGRCGAEMRMGRGGPDGMERGGPRGMDRDGPGGMMRRAGHGPMGMRAILGSPVYKSFDADGNGTVTSAEAEAGIAALHKKYDTDGNGSLSATEFEPLFAEVTKGFADRPFAALDADGDKAISAEEIAFPAKMMARMQAWQDAAPAPGDKQQ